MKATLFFLALGVVSALLIRRYGLQKSEVIHFVEIEDFETGAKNFGMFPPDIPEESFEAFGI